MDPKLLMKTGKQLCEIGTALLSACEGMEEEREPEDGSLDMEGSSEESEEDMPEDDESEEEPSDEDRKKRVKFAKYRLNRGK